MPLKGECGCTEGAEQKLGRVREVKNYKKWEGRQELVHVQPDCFCSLAFSSSPPTDTSRQGPYPQALVGANSKLFWQF